MVTKQAETFLMGEKTNKFIRSRCTDIEPVVGKRNDTNELWCTIPCHLQLYQEQIHGMYWYTRKKEEKKEKHEEGKERKIHRKGKKKENAKQTSAEGAGRVPREQGCCLLVRSVL